eukprot:836191-Pyramimonas_sp.AAC.1
MIVSTTKHLGCIIHGQMSVLVRIRNRDLSDSPGKLLEDEASVGRTVDAVDRVADDDNVEYLFHAGPLLLPEYFEAIDKAWDQGTHEVLQCRLTIRAASELH